MAQAGGTPTAGVVRYDGVVDCFVRMPRLEGMSSLYKGFVPIATRKVLWTVAPTFWSTSRRSGSCVDRTRENMRCRPLARVASHCGTDEHQSCR